MLPTSSRLSLLALGTAVALVLSTGCPPPDGGGDDDDDNNGPPLAEDDEAEVIAGQSVSIDVLDNDSDPDGDSLDIISATEPESGSLDVGNNDIEYVADSDFEGTDSFEYTIADGHGNEATATVTVEVSALPTVTITTPSGGAAISGSTVTVVFEVTGCTVARPSEDSDGCHLHRYLDDSGYTIDEDGDGEPENATGWYESSSFDLEMTTAGEHTFMLRLTKNDGSDDAWEPEVLDEVTFTTTDDGS